MPKPESYLPDSATKAITFNNGWHTQITGRVRWRVRHRTHALQNDSVKVVIKMDDTLTQSQTVQIYLDIT